MIHPSGYGKRKTLFFRPLRYASVMKSQIYTVDELAVTLSAPKISATNVQNS